MHPSLGISVVIELGGAEQALNLPDRRDAETSGHKVATVSSPNEAGLDEEAEPLLELDLLDRELFAEEGRDAILEGLIARLASPPVKMTTSGPRFEASFLASRCTLTVGRASPPSEALLELE